uniref:CDI domain-containing protein n=1 Tax=Syphacia muris TaxID=451379 RepID=A0A0N5A7X0_9BILA
MDFSFAYATSSRHACNTPKRSARRCLFGRPDPERSRQWMDEQFEEMRKAREAQSAKWCFNFDTDQPCPSASAEYVYTAVSAASVPQFYRFTRYKKEEASDTENRSPDCSDSDSSMEDVSSIPSHKLKCSRAHQPSRKQTKLISFMRVEQRKRLQRSAKIQDLCGPRTSTEVSATKLKAASQ